MAAVARAAGADEGAGSPPAVEGPSEKGVGAKGEGGEPAAPSVGATDPGSLLSAYWQGVLRAVARAQRYPPTANRRRETGTARIQVWLTPSGGLARVPRVVESSGSELLDAEALRMIEAAAPFGAVPPGVPAEFTIPIRFVRDPRR